MRYVDNQRLRAEIQQFQYRLGQWRYRRRLFPRTRRPRPGVSDALGAMVLDLCFNLSEKPNFAGYTYRSDLVSDAAMDCLIACEKYNTRLGTSAFAYLTQVAFNRMRRSIATEKKQHLIPLEK